MPYRAVQSKVPSSAEQYRAPFLTGGHWTEHGITANTSPYQDTYSQAVAAAAAAAAAVAVAVAAERCRRVEQHAGRPVW